MWRGGYFGLLAVVGMFAASTPYAASVTRDFVVGFSLLPILFYLLKFFVWVSKQWPGSPLDPIRKQWKPTILDVVDRTALFVGSNLFFVWLPPIKATFPKAHGFWADPPLANLDRTLLGQDAWRLSHSLLGPITPAIDYFYTSWVPVITGVALGVALFGSETRMARFFLGLALSWTLLGILLAGALASAGPIFGPDFGFGFTELREALVPAKWTMIIHKSLLAVYTSGQLRIGAGISAAPSIHCALTFVFLFASWRSRWFYPALVYSILIWIGSIHLGWHYFVDGLFSLIGVALLWPLVIVLTHARFLVGRTQRQNVIVCRTR
jgi:hypothetical protein